MMTIGGKSMREVLPSARLVAGKARSYLREQAERRLARPTDQTYLEPVLVRGPWGRVGSTLVMEMLGTSPEISFNRTYPCEDRCLSNLQHYLRPLSGASANPDGPWLDDPNHLWWLDPAVLGFSIQGTPLNYPELDVDRRSIYAGALRGAWIAYSKSAAWPGDVQPKFYAEKYGGGSDGLSTAGLRHYMLDLIRDPRDVWCSVLAFDAKRGYFGFGRHEQQSEEDYRMSFIEAVRRRLDEMASTGPDIPALVVRYEDLVVDPVGQAKRLADWLGVKITAQDSLFQEDALSHHRTAPSPQDTIGRWRRELTPDVNKLFVNELSAHLERYGYL